MPLEVLGLGTWLLAMCELSASADAAAHSSVCRGFGDGCCWWPGGVGNSGLPKRLLVNLCCLACEAKTAAAQLTSLCIDEPQNAEVWKGRVCRDACGKLILRSYSIAEKDREIMSQMISLVPHEARGWVIKTVRSFFVRATLLRTVPVEIKEGDR